MCKYGTEVKLSGGEIVIRCTRLTAFCGYALLVHEGWCKLHESAGGPDSDFDGNVTLASWISDSMASRVRCWDMPYHPSRIDVQALAAKLKGRLSQEQLDKVFDSALDYWANIPEDKDGFNDAQIADRAELLAGLWGCEEALARWGCEDAR